MDPPRLLLLELVVWALYYLLGSSIVSAWRQSSFSSRSSAFFELHINAGHRCLRLTKKDVLLRYPRDADSHFETLHEKLAGWQDFVLQKTGQRFQNYLGWNGPWLESEWTVLVQRLWRERASGTTLHHLFGPHVPLTLPFTDLAAVDTGALRKMWSELKGLLRPEVPYVTVVQHATGLICGEMTLDHIMEEHPNILVFSAGGYGHVPVPLPLSPMPLASKKAMAERRHFANYVGTIGHAPFEWREQMVSSLGNFSAKHGLSVVIGPNPNWTTIMADSKVSLVPRGFGRTAFHLLETLQMGLIPAYLYSDIPWVPYGRLSTTFAFSVNFSEMESFWGRLLQTSDHSLQQMEARIVALRETHFTVEAIMKHILSFVRSPRNSGDLRCERLPATVRGAEGEKPRG